MSRAVKFKPNMLNMYSAPTTLCRSVPFVRVNTPTPRTREAKPSITWANPDAFIRALCRPWRSNVTASAAAAHDRACRRRLQADVSQLVAPFYGPPRSLWITVSLKQALMHRIGQRPRRACIGDEVRSILHTLSIARGAEEEYCTDRGEIWIVQAARKLASKNFARHLRGRQK